MADQSSRTALLLIDLEREWTDPDSSYYLGRGNLDEYCDTINRLIAWARANQTTVIFIRNISREPQEPFADGSDNAELLPQLHADESDAVIEKERIDPFYGTELDKELGEIDRVIVAGILTNLCVRSAVEAAYDRDFAITLVEDCCLAMDDETHAFTVRDLRETRPEIAVTTLDGLYG